MTTRKKPKRERPWAKLWRYESRRFRALPLRARMLAAYMLKVVDDTGTLPLGGRDPVTAVALAVAADVGDRRWLRSDVEVLLEHGYVKVEGDTMLVSNYPRWQELDDIADATESETAPRGPTSTRRESNPNTTRVEPERDTSATRVEREPNARIDSSPRNDSLARTVLSEEREKREERREGERSHASSPTTLPSLDEIASTFGALRKAAGYGGFKRARSQFRDEERLRIIEHWLSSEADPRRALERAIRGFLMCTKARDAKYPLAFLVTDLESYRAQFERETGAPQDASDAADPDLEAMRERYRDLTRQREAAIGDHLKRGELLVEIQSLAKQMRAHAARAAKGEQAA